MVAITAAFAASVPASRVRIAVLVTLATRTGCPASPGGNRGLLWTTAELGMAAKPGATVEGGGGVLLDRFPRPAGRVATTDPRFDWWFPGRVSHDFIVHCEPLRREAAFALFVSDETPARRRDAGGLDDPAWWARCASPRLREVTDGDDAFSPFSVE